VTLQVSLGPEETPTPTPTETPVETPTPTPAITEAPTPTDVYPPPDDTGGDDIIGIPPDISGSGENTPPVDSILP
jgi:hypothetical protein